MRQFFQRRIRRDAVQMDNTVREVWPKFNPNAEVGMGGTGDPPVPSGHWPDGTGRTLALETDVRKSSGAVPVPSGGSPLGTGQWPVLPTEMATATSEFGLNRIHAVEIKFSCGLVGENGVVFQRVDPFRPQNFSSSRWK